MQPWLDTLDSQQHAVATSDAQILRVLAGAGTGKTTSLVARVAHEVAVRQIPANQVLLLTFTKRAAQQMVNRTQQVLAKVGLAQSTARPVGGTFHSIAHQWLRRSQRTDPRAANFNVIDRSDSTDLMSVCRSDHFVGKTPAKRFPRSSALVDIYSTAINRASTVSAVIEAEMPWARDLTEQVLAICERYRGQKQAQHLIDFDDLLLYWWASLQNGASQGEKYKHVLVDEYQDVNSLQAQIVAGLMHTDTRLTVVGDDAQAIYGFRGATPEFILNFPEQYPGASTERLTHNYRSTREILAVPNALAADAAVGFETQLSAAKGATGPVPQLVVSYDDEDQSSAVCDEVLNQLEFDRQLRDQAVLVRAANHSASLELELTARRIPYIKYGGLRYLETAHVKDCLAAFRLVANPRDELAWFRLLTMIDGVGKASVQRFLTIIRSSLPADADSISAVVGDLVASLPPRSRTSATQMLAALSSRATEDASAHAQRIISVLSPHIERKYDDGESRRRDLSILAAAAGNATSLGSLASEHILNEPSKTSGLAGEPQVGDDYLVISTIHSAKGLEWDCVHVLNVTDGCLPLDMALNDPDGLAEERRLLYVAVTRAKVQLTIHAPVRFHVDHRAQSSRHVWGQRSRFLSEPVCRTMQTVHRNPSGPDAGYIDLSAVNDTVDDLLRRTLQ